jgi:hypothetical protein
VYKDHRICDGNNIIILPIETPSIMMEDWFIYTKALNVSSKYELLLYSMALVQYNQKQFEALLLYLDQLQLPIDEGEVSREDEEDEEYEEDDEEIMDYTEGCPGWYG